MIGHAHYSPSTDGWVSKPAVRQLVGLFDWAAAHDAAAAEGGNPEAAFVALHHTGSVEGRAPGAWGAKWELPKLLVLHPRLRLEATNSLMELWVVLRGAMQVGAEIDGGCLLASHAFHNPWFVVATLGDSGCGTVQPRVGVARPAMHAALDRTLRRSHPHI